MAKGDAGRAKEAQRQRVETSTNQFTDQTQKNYNESVDRAKLDYGNIMDQYKTAGQQGQGYINSAAGGFQSMADTGGFNPDAVRARALAPTRAVFGRAQSELNRSRSLGGASPNFAAAQSKMNRDLGYGLSDASVNAEGMIQERMQQGKMAGLSGLLNSGNASSGIDFNRAGGMANLYGTTPGMPDMFGDQYLGGNQQRIEQSKNQKGTPWWEKALKVAGTAAPYVGMAVSSKELKEDIEPLDRTRALAGLKKLNLYNWKYKGNKTKHMGPMAEDFKRIFGVGDGKTLHLADVMGVTLAAAKGKVK